MQAVAGAATLGDLAIGIRAQEGAIVAELKAGSEEAYAWLIGEFQQPIYSLVYRMVSDSADAADTTQEVFLKVFRGMKHFHGESSLKTWIYRIALHEASNRRRWWFRHKSRESSIELEKDRSGIAAVAIKDSLELIPIADFLIASHFVDDGDDADLGESPDYNVGSYRPSFLCFCENTLNIPGF